jgi:hypothetical protein
MVVRREHLGITGIDVRAGLKGQQFGRFGRQR